MPATTGYITASVQSLCNATDRSPLPRHAAGTKLMHSSRRRSLWTSSLPPPSPSLLLLIFNRSIFPAMTPRYVGLVSCRSFKELLGNVAARLHRPDALPRTILESCSVLPFCLQRPMRHGTVDALSIVPTNRRSWAPVASEGHCCAGRWIGCLQAGPAAPVCSSWTSRPGTLSRSWPRRTKLPLASRRLCLHRHHSVSRRAAS